MTTRRAFLKQLGITPAALPFLSGLPGLAAEKSTGRKQRLIIMFSPNGTLPNHFWPKMVNGEMEFGSILNPLTPFKDQTLVIKGLSNLVKGDGGLGGEQFGGRSGAGADHRDRRAVPPWE